ncbi:hypothetical protein O3M35_013254 [Rhynocoris fuscipes]|uniref:Uncharacterized protein n=1 Tax=Rhynocoris fuscipes TaxID=488301 RepID=A0AAW1CES9_9HEMI
MFVSCEGVKGGQSCGGLTGECQTPSPSISTLNNIKYFISVQLNGAQILSKFQINRTNSVA